ncbi:MAG: hypothetical protein JXC36_09060 [Candidatus Atribacteria bacterium]|nr:hypothetical protein [Candidatus Atribacteria bacterium]
MIDIQTFNKSTDDFDKREGRTNFFTLAKNLIDSGFEIEGLLLILTTWNFAIFRYAVKQFDINNFKKTLGMLKRNFDKLNGQNFRTINFDDYKSDIQTIYNSLSKIKGVEFTGAPKLMHLKNPDVFVMWDAYIRGEKPKKYYDKLDTFKNGTFEFKKYSKDFDGYFGFIKDMQDKFKHLNLDGQKSLAKAVDEFNYVNITLAIQGMEKNYKRTKRINKQRPANNIAFKAQLSQKKRH